MAPLVGLLGRLDVRERAFREQLPPHRGAKDLLRHLDPPADGRFGQPALPQVDHEAVRIAGGDFVQPFLPAEVGQQGMGHGPTVRARVRLVVGAPGQVGVHEFPQGGGRRHGRPPGDQARGRQLPRQAVADLPDPPRRLGVERAAGHRGRHQVLDLGLDPFGHVLRDLAEPDALALAVGGDELDGPPAAGPAGNARHEGLLSCTRRPALAPGCKSGRQAAGKGSREDHSPAAAGGQGGSRE
ncbi:MAG TPA: hypothetical protein VNK04_19240 [Gemmataceae bacterium]|nr:hypothetical protein [Gemmataceae bacterium]